MVDSDGYGVRPGQKPLDRLLEDCRTLSPLGVERAAEGWVRQADRGNRPAWHAAEKAALHLLESQNRAPEWDELRNRVLGLTERAGALIAWRMEHGDTGHMAENALLGSALALLAGDQLDGAHRRALVAPMAQALPWLTEGVPAER
jgi:hypothetical protein